jgi:hypothetical protein
LAIEFDFFFWTILSTVCDTPTIDITDDQKSSNKFTFLLDDQSQKQAALTGYGNMPL